MSTKNKYIFKKDEIDKRIRDLKKEIEYNNSANGRLQEQKDSLKEDIIIFEKPKMLESDLEIMVMDLADMVQGILEDMSENISDYKPEFEIGYNNEVLISNIDLDYDATEDIQKYIEDKFNIIVPDQTENTN